MASIQIHSDDTQNITVLSNTFLDRFLPRANGEFLKVYLYLLRSCKSSGRELSLCSVADALNCTENDVLRALRYWENEGVLFLDTDETGAVTAISFGRRSPQKDPAPANKDTAHIQTPAAPARIEPTASEVSPDRMAELAQQEDFLEIVFSAQKHLGKLLTTTETRKLVFFYDELRFSADLIDYLIEYCVSRNHKSFHYIEKVALNWHTDGITTVNEAQKASEHYQKNYYEILKALGITTPPLEAQISFMKKWIEEWKFPMELILEACSRTVLNAAKPSLSYTDRILLRWKDQNAFTMEAVKGLDAAREKEAAARADRAKNKAPAQKRSQAGSFSQFHQRKYDYASLEQKLLNQ
ncbi:MAG: DnaD domain protein [Lachnospiraceae bacterium]|nr:DnaD domain protein [Lachnospiraceae bacterium]